MAALCRAEKCSDNGRVVECIFQRNRHLCIFYDRPYELIALYGVLIDRGNDDFFRYAGDISAVIDQQTRWKITRLIKRNFDLYPLLFSEKLHRLPRYHLRAAGEYRLARGKL